MTAFIIKEDESELRKTQIHALSGCIPVICAFRSKLVSIASVFRHLPD